MSQTLRIDTEVGTSGWEDHWFRGFRLFRDLAGRTRYWSLLSIAVGGPRLSHHDEMLLDDLCACGNVCDPRIPAFKICRLVGAYGGSMYALSGAYLPQAGGVFGLEAIGLAASLLRRLAQAVNSGESRIETELKSIAGGQESTPGFGVPGRHRDERVIAFNRCLERRGRADGAYWQLFRAADEYLAREFHRPANMYGAVAALLLDIGLQVEQVTSFAIGLMIPSAVANVAEGVQQAPEVLRRIPDEWIEYKGPPPRTSPRAKRRNKPTSRPLSSSDQ